MNQRSALETPPMSEAMNRGRRLYEIFRRGQYKSIKHDSYFQVYERVFERFVGQAITFVEVGVLNGGSLFMWRDYFGPQARIIGVDLNPGAKRWEADGFEIHIGSQSDAAFWTEFYAKVGPVHVLLDDGGHTNEQQLITTVQALPHIVDGGLIMVEDTHASYMTVFDNPSDHSFINFCKFIADSVNRRSGQLKRTESDYWQHVFSLEFFESIVVMHIDRPRCFVGGWIENDGEDMKAQDFRTVGVRDRAKELDESLAFMNHIVLLKSVKRRVVKFARYLSARQRDRDAAVWFPLSATSARCRTAPASLCARPATRSACR